MNVVPLDPDGHGAVQLLLPWYVTRRLADEEQAEVEAHLAGCARCRAELALERQLQASLAMPEAVGGMERDLASLRARLAAGEPARQAPGGYSWRGWRWAGSVLALAGVFAVVLPFVPLDGARYRGLGGAGPPANAVVKFRAEATEMQISSALRASGARLVGGPTATQTYLLALPVADAQALARLRQMPGVSLAESLDAEPAP